MLFKKMQKNYRYYWNLVIGIVVSVVISQVSAKTLVFCSEGSPEGFNPQLFNSGTTFDATAPIYNALTQFKQGSTEILPSLAESWDVSADNKVYTFHLRRGVKWQSNKHFSPTREFNADDVIFSFLRQKDANHPYHKISGGNYQYFNSLEMKTLINKIEKIDDYTVRFELNYTDVTFITNMAMDFTSILSAEYAEAMLKAGKPEEIDLKPLGTGSFRLVSYEKDSRILYQAFNGYWGEKPKIDRLIFSITPDATIRTAKLRKNECQIMAYPKPEDLASLSQDENIQLLHRVGLNTGYLAYNMHRPPLDNLKVRQALSMSVDRQSIMKVIYKKMGTIAEDLLPPGLLKYDYSTSAYPYDPKKAKVLLKEAGFAKGFTIELWAMPVARPYNPDARRMAEMIQSDWKKIGVKTKIVTYEWGEYLKRAADGEHQAILYGWIGDNGDPDNFLTPLFSCAATNGGINYSQWCYPAFDEILKRGKVTSDVRERVALYKQAQLLMHQEVPALMIAHSIVYEPIRKNVKGYVINPIGGRHNFSRVSLE